MGDVTIRICNVHHIVAKVDLWVLASFKACQTMERCSQQPRTFSIHPFWIELSMSLLLYIKWISRRLETRLKKVCPQHLKELYWVKVWEFGIRWSAILRNIALRHCKGILYLLKQAWKTLKRNWFVFGHFLLTLSDMLFSQGAEAFLRVAKIAKKSS